MYRRHRRAISWLLAVTMTLSPSATYCQPPPSSSETPATTPTTETTATTPATAVPAAPAAAKPDLDLGYVTPETMSAVVVYPRHVLTSPEMELMPLEVLTAWGVKELGIDPLQVESIMAIAEPPQVGAAGRGGRGEDGQPAAGGRNPRPGLGGIPWKTKSMARPTAAGRRRGPGHLPRERPHAAGRHRRDLAQGGEQSRHSEGREDERSCWAA